MGGTKWSEVCSWRLCKIQIILLLIFLTVPESNSGDMEYSDAKLSAIRAFCPDVDNNGLLYIVSIYNIKWLWTQPYPLPRNSTDIARERCEYSRRRCLMPVYKSLIYSHPHRDIFGRDYICITGANFPRTAEAYDGSVLTMSCSDVAINSRINIMYSSIWWHTHGLCIDNDSQVIESGPCTIDKPINLTHWCVNDSQSCSIPVNRNIFDGVEWNSYKLDVEYRCISGYGSANFMRSVDVRRVLTISCTNSRFNSSTDIHYAKFSVKHVCYTNADITSIVRKWCENDTHSCSIPAKREDFRYTRWRPYRLYIQYLCISEKSYMYFRKSVNEEEVLTISCTNYENNSIIDILYAEVLEKSYPCIDQLHATNAKSIIRKWCENDSYSCSIPVNSEFLRSVEWTGYSLYIQYRCISDYSPVWKSLTVEEGRVMTISCTDVRYNSIIDILYAQILGWHACYRFIYVTSIVKKWCENQSQNCSIPVNNSVFKPESCFLLKVDYICTKEEVNMTLWTEARTTVTGPQGISATETATELVNTTFWTEEARTTVRQGISATETAAGDALKIGLGLTLSLVFVILVLIGVIIYIVKRKQSNSQSKDVKDIVHYSDIKDHYAEIEEPNQSKGTYTAPVPVNIFNKHIYKDLEPSSSPVQIANAAAY